MNPLVLVLASAIAVAGCAPAAAPAAPAAAPASAARPFAMRTYTFVLLRRGPTWTAEESPETKRLSEGHMANIQAMGKAGKLKSRSTSPGACFGRPRWQIDPEHRSTT